jgi:hypothetical protein
MNIALAQAIQELVPNAIVNVINDKIEWIEPTVAPVTKEQLELKAKEIQERNMYKFRRMKDYPAISDQLDMIWHTINSGGTLDQNSDFYKSIKQVKDNNPKTT